jgi:TetR/AcrR family tetracycline transcriptional repressor
MSLAPKAQRLERPMIVRKALELLNEEGLDGLTTRRLADALNVQGPALYWHFKNKQELIDEMAMAMMDDAFGPLDPSQHWTDWLVEGASRIRSVMLSYRDGARLFAGYRPRESHGRMDPATFLGPLLAAGFSADEAHSIATVIGRFTFGWTVDEQATMERPPSPQEEPHLDPNELFEFGLATIIDGLKARLARSRNGAKG